MEIYLVRHTTPDIAKGICYGHANIGVTKSFDTEVALIKKQLPLKNDCKVYSSPLLRCYYLASALNNCTYLDNRLKEVNFGTWENVAWDNIPKEEIDPWMSNFVTATPPMGESYIQLQARVIDFFNALIEKHNEDETVIIVSHAGPIRAWLAHIQQIELKDSFDIKIDYGQVFKIQYVNNTFTLVS